MPSQVDDVSSGYNKAIDCSINKSSVDLFKSQWSVTVQSDFYPKSINNFLELPFPTWKLLETAFVNNE